MSRPICRNCAYFDQNKKDNWGLCRRNAPTARSVDDSDRENSAEWPRVWRDDWCGQGMWHQTLAGVEVARRTSWTADELCAATLPPPTLPDLVALVDGGDCTPACLLGAEVGPCDCRCGGKFHAVARYA